MDRTKEILKILKENPDGLTTTAIAEKCKAHRATVIADLRELLALRTVRVQKAGPSKIYHLVERMTHSHALKRRGILKG